MSARKLVLMVALVLPGVALVVTPGPASASSKPVGAGTLTCSVGGEVSFNPSINEYGTNREPGARKVAVEIDLQLTDCSGPDANAPQPNPTATTVSGGSHLADTPVEFMGHIMRVLGGCGFGDFDSDAVVKSTEKWTGGSQLAATRAKLDVDTMGGLDEGGAVGDVTGTSTGSYPGPVSGTLNLTANSVDEYDEVCNGDGGDASFSFLQFDASTSTMTFGEPAP